MVERLGEPLSLEVLAAKVGVSRYTVAYPRAGPGRLCAARHQGATTSGGALNSEGVRPRYAR